MEVSKIIGVRELEEQASEVIRQVREEGQTIDISYGGAVVARLMPVRPAAVVDEADEAVWVDLERLSMEISALWPSGISAVDAIRDVRDED